LRACGLITWDVFPANSAAGLIHEQEASHKASGKPEEEGQDQDDGVSVHVLALVGSRDARR
jgi:hypothetical protein